MFKIKGFLEYCFFKTDPFHSFSPKTTTFVIRSVIQKVKTAKNKALIRNTELAKRITLCNTLNMKENIISLRFSDEELEDLDKAVQYAIKDGYIEKENRSAVIRYFVANYKEEIIARKKHDAKMVKIEEEVLHRLMDEENG